VDAWSWEKEMPCVLSCSVGPAGRQGSADYDDTDYASKLRHYAPAGKLTGMVPVRLPLVLEVILLSNKASWYLPVSYT